MCVTGGEVANVAGEEHGGIRTANGTQVAVSVIDHEVRRDPLNVVACLDIKGAHSNIRRDALERICAEEAPMLCSVLRTWYSEPTPKTWRGDTTEDLSTSTGAGQGFPEADPLYCAGQCRVVRSLKSAHPEVRVVADQADTYLVGHLENKSCRPFGGRPPLQGIGS